MQECIKLLHEIVFVEESDGEIVYQCVPCGKRFIQFNDCCAGR